MHAFIIAAAPHTAHSPDDEVANGILENVEEDALERHDAWQLAAVGVETRGLAVPPLKSEPARTNRGLPASRSCGCAPSEV